MVIAHRGASRAERENTVAAFRRAVALGADWVELDVRVAPDRSLVVHHDALATGVPAHVPRLDAALVACEPLGVHIEIKNDDRQPAVAARVVAEAAAWGGRFVVSCFDLSTVDAARDAGAPTAWIVASADSTTVAVTAAHGHGGLHPNDATVTPEVVARCRDAGLEVNVWTVDDPARIRTLAAWGVDGVVTNVPDVARAALAGPG